MLDWLSTIFYALEPYLKFPDVIKHILDIACVALLLYQLLLLVRKTRAEQVLKGVAFILGITLVARVLRFNTMLWVLENTLQFGVIAIAIVFQPELRKALEQIGRGKFITNRFLVFEDETQITQFIEEVAAAIINMSKSKTGALVLIERETGVNDIIETGVKIEATLSRELLENIFVPQTPLHDGAVVIRAGRIEAAGCFLPLTENSSLSKQLGTRHRAALGISENCDAIVFVVSEETGVISMAKDGRLMRYLDVDAVKNILKDIYMVKEPPKPKVQKNLFRRHDQ